MTASPPTPPPSARPLPWSYRPMPGHFDEMADLTGGVRPPWRLLLSSIGAMGAGELARRWTEGRRLIHENGVTYNVYGDPLGLERPWQLDPLPLVISPGEWATLSAAVAQRARLFDTLLADLYGQQATLAEGLLPPDLVYGHPGFLRPLHGVPVPGNTRLHLYAADLVRGPDGSWCVLNDRTQAPSGAGYALENRLVLKRLLPDVFHDAQVQRLAPFFAALRATLHGLAPAHRDNPRIVLLTPGPYNETYFEHAYLARYLGYSLAEGGDLTVRDDRVYLKTLSGLLPVDVILRRQDDGFCDPLELRGDSTLGVPGLVQAVRAGRVAVANALGSGLVESGAAMAYLPALCHRLLGEPLALPSVPTRWCGDAANRREVIDRLDRYVLKPAVPGAGTSPAFGAALAGAERDKLLARLRATPGRLFAQEQIELSTAPVWTEAGLTPRHVVVRAYAVATGDGGYAVMPGGLTRVSASMATLEVSMQRGGGSKDTWVLGESPQPAFSLLAPATTPIDVSRASYDLPSRVADNLFWLGRYSERLEAHLRLIRACLSRLTDEQGSGATRTPAAVARLLPAVGVASADRLIDNLVALVHEREKPHGLRWLADQLRRIAWRVRDRISRDTWRVFNRLEADFGRPPAKPPFHATGTLELLDGALLNLLAFSGLVAESTTRSQGWRFLDLGRRIERAMQVSALVGHGLSVGDAAEDDAIALVLESADSAMTYRSRYLTSLRAGLVIDLLLLDEANPRAVAYQLARLTAHIDELPLRHAGPRLPAESRLALELHTLVRVATVEPLAATDVAGRRPELHKLRERLATDLPALADAVGRSYLSHAVPFRPLARAVGDSPS